MAFEGTGKYFWILFGVYLFVNIIVKMSLSKLFKEAREKGWKAYIPFYNRLVLVNLFDLKKSVFYKTLIPFANLYYYYIIISRMLEVYGMDKKEAIWFIIAPVYKFPELVLKNPTYKLHMYDNTEEFIKNENVLYKQPQAVAEVTNMQIQPEPQPANQEVSFNPSDYRQVSQSQYIQNISGNADGPENVFSNSSLEPDERKETIIEAKPQEEEQEKNPIYAAQGKQRVCPKCKTKLPNTAKVCFFCGETLPWHWTNNLI